MKTSYKILIGVGAVVALYIAWELFLALKDSSSGNGQSETGDTDDYDTYLKSITNSSSGSSKSTTKAKTNWGSWDAFHYYSTEKDSKAAQKFPLKYGSKNNAVKSIQYWLNRYYFGYEKLDMDGSYGPATNSAFADFDTYLRGKFGNNTELLYSRDGSHYTISLEQYKKLENVFRKTDSSQTTAKDSNWTNSIVRAAMYEK